MAGWVKAQRQQLKARSWALRGWWTWWDSAAAWLGLVGTGWERELIDGAHASVRGGEREDVEDRRRESNKKMYSAEYAKGMSRPSGPTNGTGIHRKNRFFNFKDFWNFDKTLRISTWRFRRNFDTRTFPQFFYDPQGFLENTIYHAMNATLSQIKLIKYFS
jgi:hypothetical protein